MLYLYAHNSVNQDDPMKATILNEQFQSELQESTDADRSM